MKHISLILSLVLCMAFLMSCAMHPNAAPPTTGTETPSQIETITPTTTSPTTVESMPPVESTPETTTPSESIPDEVQPTTPDETKPSEPPVTEPPTTEPSQPTAPTEPEPTEPKPTEPKPTEPPVAPEPTEPQITFKKVNETVYATSTVNVRTGPSTDYEKVGQLSKDESVKRIGIGSNGWSKIEYKGEIRYVSSNYLTTTKPIVLEYPLVYEDETCKITIYKEWYKNAYVYATHLEFKDFSRFGTSCANGKYNNGYETTSHAAKRLSAIFAVNGCYSAPYLNYTVVRNGKIWNGADRNLWSPGVYSYHTGLFQSAWESGGTPGIAGCKVQQLVDEGKITDTFCFGPPGLINGALVGKNEGARAQRTFMGTNGNAGDIWVCVSDGRYNDGKSAGLTFYEAMQYLKEEKGCTFGLHLDGGGSSTMYFQGQVLNAAKGNERAVVDFVYFK